MERAPAEKPIDVATQETVRFVSGAVPPGARILEIGCGAGDVALELGRCGYDVTGIDADPEQVRIAASRGVFAMRREWPEDPGLGADAILFTRSLHHIRDLAGAINLAYRYAATLLVEDFDFPAVDRATVDWFVSKYREGLELGLVSGEIDEFARRIADAQDSLTAWQVEHDHDLHTATRIGEAIERWFFITERHDAPYVFRYFVPVLRGDTAAASWLQSVLDEEKSRTLIGRRIVARVREGRYEDAG